MSGGGTADVLLSDGATVHIRPITVDDADAIVAMHSRFSERTRYLRYFSPYPRIPARDLARFVTVDHADREALVVEQGGGLIAVGRYDRLGPEAVDAEVAFVVEDAYQGRGIGSILLEHLASLARDRGIHRFVAEVLPQNSTMLRVFFDTGYEVSRAYADGVVHLEFAIAPTLRSAEVQWGRERRTEAASIAPLLAPRSVSVHGVRHDGTGFGAVLAAHLAGFTGAVHVVGPGETAPEPVDLAVIAVPAAAVLSTVESLAGAKGAVVVSAGFAETGTPEGVAAQRELVEAARRARLRLVGPNSLGVLNTDPAVGLNATLAPRPAAGRVGMFVQTGAMGVALLAEADRRGVGISTFVSSGNRADVSGNDLLQYWRSDPGTDVVLMYLETFGNPRKFARIARAIGRDKPLAAVVTGSPASSLDTPAAASLLAQSGVIGVRTATELFDVAQLLAAGPLPTGDRVAVVAETFALAHLATGAARRVGLVPSAYVGGPLADSLSAALSSAEADAVVIVAAPPVQPSAPDAPLWSVEVPEVERGAGDVDKPVLACVVGGAPRLSGRLAYYAGIEEAMAALRRVVTYAAWRREPVGVLPPSYAVVAADVLARYGIEVVAQATAADADAVVSAARELVGARGTVALKAAAEGLQHRLDLGAVRLNVTGERQLRAAYADIAAAFGPEVVVQPMAPPGVACVVEVLDDPSFGPVVGFGLGGLALELLGDRAWRAAPLTDLDARALVREPRAAPVLHGYRGGVATDESALVDLLLRVGQLAAEEPTVKRLTLNPVLAHERGCSVLSATVQYGATSRVDTGPRQLH